MLPIRYTAGTLLVFALLSPPLQAERVMLNPIKDNTLYESPTGSLSNGAGAYLFAGRVGSRGGTARRRALLSFDIAGNVPSGAVIQSVVLTMNMSRTIVGAQTVRLHRVLADWGEGTSNPLGNEGNGALSSPGDATWIHTFFNNSFWANQGGDFSPTESASVSVAGVGKYSWGTTAQMVADVQDWLGDPGANFGWVLVGNEATGSTSKRFDSRQNTVAVNRPVLTVDFETSVPETPTPTLTPEPPTPTSTPTPTPFPQDLVRDGVINALDLLVFIGQWRTMTGADLNGDGRVDFLDAALFSVEWKTQIP